MMGGLAAAGAACVRAFSPESGSLVYSTIIPCATTPEIGANEVLACAVLPIIAYVVVAVHIGIDAKMDILGQAVCIVERKLDVLFDEVGDQAVHDARIEIARDVHGSLFSTADPHSGESLASNAENWSMGLWGSPILWERFVRNRFRLFDRPVLRGIASLSAAFALSLIIMMLYMWHTRGSLSNWNAQAITLYAGGYLEAGLLLSIFFARRNMEGRFDWLKLHDRFTTNLKQHM
jgi:hypothetical protein